MLGSTLLPKILLKKNSIVVGIDNLKLGKIKFIKKFLNKKNFFFFKANLDKRIKESEALGFTNIIVPKSNLKRLKKLDCKIKVLDFQNVKEVLNHLF